jgi:N-acetylmuramoyl-L-alanine amidase
MERIMSKLSKKSIALFCAVCLLSAMLSSFVFAEEDGEVYIDEIESDVVITQGELTELQSIGESEQSYAEIPIQVVGSMCTGYMLDSITYVPIQEFCDALGVPVEVIWEEDAAVLSVKAEGLEISVKSGDRYMAANGRCLYLKNGIYRLDDTMLLPIRELAKCFGADVFWNAEEMSVDVTVPPAELRESFSSDDTFYNAEDLYWLSHIINAEAGNQTLEGMIGVGNVVLNRVADPSCPKTIYDVIFDDRYGVQFSPTVTGTIYDEPNELSVIAAKCCLEGCELVGDSLFFVNPQIGVTGWFASTRTYVATIGDHAFYA